LKARERLAAQVRDLAFEEPEALGDFEKASSEERAGCFLDPGWARPSFRCGR
jgi:hypothetical protein